MKTKLGQYLSDYLRLLRFEQRGLGLILLICMTLFLLPQFIDYETTNDSNELQVFQDLVANNELYVLKEIETEDLVSGLNIIPFDPNTISEEELKAMNLPPGLIKSIVNFRKKKGSFRTANDLSRMYGMTDDIFVELLPFVFIESSRANAVKPDKKKATASVLKLSPFNANTVTGEELKAMNLPIVFVNSLINYRTGGGVYRSIKDLKILYGSSPVLLSKLKPFVIFNNEVDDLSGINSLSADIVYFNFNPNSIGKDSLLLLGISENVANIWINFRNSGKIFETVSDLNSIFGLKADKINELKPYLVFVSNALAYEDEVKASSVKLIQIDINKSDMATYQTIKGIGQYYAKNIVWYREKLGGFYSIDQLMEIDNFPDSVFVKIRDQLIAEDFDLIKININNSSVKEMQSHPYISYEEARNIYNFRTGIRNLKNFQDLVNLGLVSEENISKIEPYLSF